MNLTAKQITKAINEICPLIAEAFLHKVIQTDEDEWVLELRKDSKKLWLLISLSPKNSRIHLLSAKPENKVKPESFTRLLKKTLLRTVLSAVKQINDDRIVRLDFTTRDAKYSLAAEVMGSRGNLYLLNEEGQVIALALHRKTANTPGGEYVLPRRPDREKKGEKDKDLTRGQKPAGDGECPYNRELEERFADSAQAERLARCKTRALSPLKAELKKTAKRIKTLEKEKTALERWADEKKIGDILQSNFDKMRKGAKSIEVQDIFSPSGEMIEITLDPSKNPAENLKAHYKRFRKYEKGLPRIEQDLETLNSNEKESLEKIELIESATEIEKIEPYLPEPRKKKTASKKKKEEGPTGRRKFVSSEGYPVLVGRNDRENDEITFRISNGRDLWLHARDYPGSHVLARLPKGLKGFPQATLKEAAMLALHYSKAAKAGKGEVTYCHAKDVRKPKGAPSGKALVSGAKSIMVRIDPEIIRAMKDRANKP